MLIIIIIIRDNTKGAGLFQKACQAQVESGDPLYAALLFSILNFNILVFLYFSISLYLYLSLYFPLLPLIRGAALYYAFD